MNGIPFNAGLVVAGILFIIGLVGVLVRRNIIFILMGIEIMLNASGLAFITAGAKWAQADGQIIFIFILSMAAAEVSIGLGLILIMYHQFSTLDTDVASKMRG